MQLHFAVSKRLQVAFERHLQVSPGRWIEPGRLPQYKDGSFAESSPETFALLGPAAMLTLSHPGASQPSSTQPGGTGARLAHALQHEARPHIPAGIPPRL